MHSQDLPAGSVACRLCFVAETCGSSVQLGRDHTISAIGDAVEIICSKHDTDYPYHGFWYLVQRADKVHP